ncbi:putative short-chain dehydrogenase [Ustulina deusta]|nr:putative short-chain dehydrogenase [Ustulina deusta]
MGSPKGTILLTGANGGLGSAIAKQLASHQQFAEYHCLYAVRNATSAPDLHKAIGPEGQSHPREVISLNLTNLDNVRDVAETINTRVSDGKIPPIKAIILNAGFQDFGKQVWTDSFDTTFVANYLGHWLLTLLLLKSMDKSSGRIVVIGSQSHDPHDKRNDSTGAFDDEKYKTVIQDQSTIDAIARGSWSSAEEDPSWKSGYRRYGAAKLFSVMMIHELQSRMDRDPVLNNVCILGVDPGTMTTGLQRHASWVVRVLVFQIIYPIIAFFTPNGLVRSTHKSATQVLNAAFDSGSGPTTFPKDRYYFDEKPFQTSEESRDVHKRGLVWKESVKYARLKGDETILSDWA